MSQQFPPQQLLDFQRSYTIEYNKVNQYPMEREYEYDFLGYLRHNLPLENKRVYQYVNPHKKYDFLHEYAEQIHFGRKRHFGRAYIYIK